MPNIHMINKYNNTTQGMDVYDPYVDNQIIGRVAYNEVYVRDTSSGDGVFRFLFFKNTSGNLQYGRFGDYPGMDETFWGPIETKAFTPQYRYGQYYINGEYLDMYPVRRQTSVYTAGGSYWGSVGTNEYILCSYPLAGASNPGWVEAQYVSINQGTAWYAIQGDGVNHGFVDIGFAYGSGKTTLSVYGNW